MTPIVFGLELQLIDGAGTVNLDYFISRTARYASPHCKRILNSNQ